MYPVAFGAVGWRVEASSFGLWGVGIGLHHGNDRSESGLRIFRSRIEVEVLVSSVKVSGRRV